MYFEEIDATAQVSGFIDRLEADIDEISNIHIIDFKTSKKVKTVEEVEDYWWQTTAYALMYEELVGEPIHNLVVLMAVQDQPPIPMQQKTEDHIHGLVNAIKFYKNQYN